jgi:hypothetical protein
MIYIFSRLTEELKAFIPAPKGEGSSACFSIIILAAQICYNYFDKQKRGGNSLNDRLYAEL